MNANEENQTVDLTSFANMAGFPVELVKKELFANSEDSDQVSLASLRNAMLNYLDTAMLQEE
jgi:hypothetical protein